MQQQGSPGSLTTLRLRGQRNFDTALLLDGLRVRDAGDINGSALSLFSDLVPVALDRVEVLRGAGSSIYGSHAIGGVVNMIPGVGSSGFHLNAGFDGGSLGTFRERLEASGGGKLFGFDVGVNRLDVRDGIDGDEHRRVRMLGDAHDCGALRAADVAIAAIPLRVKWLPATLMARTEPVGRPSAWLPNREVGSLTLGRRRSFGPRQRCANQRPVNGAFFGSRGRIDIVAFVHRCFDHLRFRFRRCELRLRLDAFRTIERLVARVKRFGGLLRCGDGSHGSRCNPLGSAGEHLPRRPAGGPQQRPSETMSLTAMNSYANVQVKVASSTCRWVAIPEGRLGGVDNPEASGDGWFSYSLGTNTSAEPRFGRIRVVFPDQSALYHTFTQERPLCSYVPVPAEVVLPAPGGSASFRILATPETCAWRLDSDSGGRGITVTSPSKGVGSATVTYRVSPPDDRLSRSYGIWILPAEPTSPEALHSVQVVVPGK